jgi:hypothetical protein
MPKRKRTKNDIKIITHKTKDRVMRTPLKMGRVEVNSGAGYNCFCAVIDKPDLAMFLTSCLLHLLLFMVHHVTGRWNKKRKPTRINEKYSHFKENIRKSKTKWIYRKFTTVWIFFVYSRRFSFLISSPGDVMYHKQ